MLMSFTPAVAAGESLTDVVAEIGVSNMDGLKDVFESYFTDSKLDSLNTYLNNNYNELLTNLQADGVDVDMLKALVADIKDVSLADSMSNTNAANAIAAKKEDVKATLGDITNRLVIARGGASNTEYAFDIIVNHIFNETSVVTYNTSTEVYTLDFSAYKIDGMFVPELRQVMPSTFSILNYAASIDSLEEYFQYILNSTDFATHKTDFNATIDAWNGGVFYNEYTPAIGGGGGGGGVFIPEEAEEPVVNDPVIDGSNITTTVENAAIVTTSDGGTEEAVIDDEAVTGAIEEIVDEVGGTAAVPTIVLEIPNSGTDLSVALQVGTIDTLTENEVNLSIKTANMTCDVPFGMIDTGNIITDAGDALEDDFELRFTSTEQDMDTVLEGIDTTSEDGVALAEAIAGKSKIIEISLDIFSDGEKVGGIHDFDKSLTIRISLADIPDADPDKLGIYYIDEETGVPVFMGGKIVTVDGVQMIEFSTMHLSKFAVIEGQATYPDIAVHWSKKYVESMGDKHIVAGYPDGTFKPENAVTRAEFAKLLVESMGYGSMTYEGTFSDVDAADWHAECVAAAVANGIIKGYEDGTFQPDKSITRLEMTAMLSNAVKNNLLESENKVLASFADDAAIATWGRTSAAKAVEAGLINGMDGAFNPEGTTTRAQAATAIYRLYNK